MAPEPVAEARTPLPLPVPASDRAIGGYAVLDTLWRMGPSASEHVVALLRRTHPDRQDMAEVLRLDRLLAELEAKHEVESMLVPVAEASLRVYERTYYRVTEAGRAAARGGGRRASLLAGIVALEPDLPPDLLSAEFIRSTVFAHWAETKHVAAWLRGCERVGLVERVVTRSARLLRAYRIAPAGMTRLRETYRTHGLLLPRQPVPLAEHLVRHHVHTVRAAAWLVARIREQGTDVRIIRMVSDPEARARGRRGRRTAKGSRYPLLPDGILYVASDGHVRGHTIEVISGYTAAQIESKHAALGDDVTYVATSPQVADRVAAMALPRPVVIEESA